MGMKWVNLAQCEVERAKFGGFVGGKFGGLRKKAYFCKQKFVNSDKYEIFGMDTKKIIQTLAYLAWKQEGHVLDNMKAYKLMWLADRYHVRHNTRTVTGDDYWALPYGPVPSDAKNLIDGRQTAKKSPVGMMDEYLEVLPEHRFRARKEPDVMVFSQSDREALDLVLERFGWMSPVQLSELSHTFPEWQQYEPMLKDESKRNGYLIDKDLFFVNKEEASGLFVDNPEMLTFAKQMFHEMQEC